MKKSKKNKQKTKSEILHKNLIQMISDPIIKEGQSSENQQNEDFQNIQIDFSSISKRKEPSIEQRGITYGKPLKKILIDDEDDIPRHCIPDFSTSQKISFNFKHLQKLNPNYNYEQEQQKKENHNQPKLQEKEERMSLVQILTDDVIFKKSDQEPQYIDLIQMDRQVRKQELEQEQEEREKEKEREKEREREKKREKERKKKSELKAIPSNSIPIQSFGKIFGQISNRLIVKLKSNIFTLILILIILFLATYIINSKFHSNINKINNKFNPILFINFFK